MKKISVQVIDQCLPQTQCGLCEYEGCKPYAEAISLGEANINKCLPGGIRVLEQLGTLLDKETEHLIEDMRLKQKAPSVAVIDEQLCIGCVKCIAACPVDAIIGTGKKMHTVLAADCTGCELCIEPCPMDCISMQLVDKPDTEIEWQAFAAHAKKNYIRKKERIAAQTHNSRQTHKQQVQANTSSEEAAKLAKQAYIKAALERVKKGRS
ncbi:MAG: [Fe-S]-binding protein [Legionellales bacterium]|mgnify:CR=1 FL=1|nr:[Fe-S]-binding protein [Legionellales bacterium]|tara:strand:- start:298 stop:924 length:627 start_codon:yes stop_codon:yes gene_type:complete